MKTFLYSAASFWTGGITVLVMDALTRSGLTSDYLIMVAKWPWYVACYWLGI